MKSFVLLPSPNSVYIRGRMTSLQGLPNSFCQDNNTGKATVDGVRSDGCRCTGAHIEMDLVPLTGPPQHDDKHFNYRVLLLQLLLDLLLQWCCDTTNTAPVTTASPTCPSAKSE